MYIYISLVAPESVVCLCMCVCVFVCMVSNQNTSKKPLYVSDLSKHDTLMHKTHIKVLLVRRYQGSTGVDP